MATPPEPNCPHCRSENTENRGSLGLGPDGVPWGYMIECRDCLATWEVAGDGARKTVGHTVFGGATAGVMPEGVVFGADPAAATRAIEAMRNAPIRVYADESTQVHHEAARAKAELDVASRTIAELRDGIRELSIDNRALRRARDEAERDARELRVEAGMAASIKPDGPPGAMRVVVMGHQGVLFACDAHDFKITHVDNGRVGRVTAEWTAPTVELPNPPPGRLRVSVENRAHEMNVPSLHGRATDGNLEVATFIADLKRDVSGAALEAIETAALAARDRRDEDGGDDGDDASMSGVHAVPDQIRGQYRRVFRVPRDVIARLKKDGMWRWFTTAPISGINDEPEPPPRPRHIPDVYTGLARILLITGCAMSAGVLAVEFLMRYGFPW